MLEKGLRGNWSGMFMMNEGAGDLGINSTRWEGQLPGQRMSVQLSCQLAECVGLSSGLVMWSVVRCLSSHTRSTSHVPGCTFLVMEVSRAVRAVGVMHRKHN